MTHQLPAREIPIPLSLSTAAQAFLASRSVDPVIHFPPLDDKAAWRAHVSESNRAFLPILEQLNAGDPLAVQKRHIGNVPVYDVAPQASRDDDHVILDMHGGALIYCGGEITGVMAEAIARRLQRRVVSIDYRMPPDHPFPAALDDGMAVYRALLKDRPLGKIVFHGGSAGGNLVAALILKARDEGLPLPACAILDSPEVDLTEAGDTFNTNMGLDRVLGRLFQINLLYADGNDLQDPLISPLFGDFSKGFPPTMLISGTRDVFLSNAVRMHRALRVADIHAELHVGEAAPHGGFPAGTPEGQEMSREVQRFMDFWCRTS